MKLSQVNKQEILCPDNYCQQSLIDIPQSNCMISLVATFLLDMLPTWVKRRFFTFHNKAVLVLLNKTFSCAALEYSGLQFSISVLSWWSCVWIFLIPPLSGKMTFFSTFGKTQEISTFMWHWWAVPNKVNRVKIRTMCFSVCLHMCMCSCWCKQLPISAFLWRTGKTRPHICIIFLKMCYVTNSLGQRWSLLCVFFISNCNVSVLKNTIMCTIKCNVSLWFPSKFYFKFLKIVTFSEQLMWQISTGILSWILSFQVDFIFKLWGSHKILNSKWLFSYFWLPFSTAKNFGLTHKIFFSKRNAYKHFTSR